jgi:hypothetical protein
MIPRLPPDPRLRNIDHELSEIVFEQFKCHIDLVAIHLRDARNILPRKGDKDCRLFAKATLLLAAAALESNLVFLSNIALRVSEKRPALFLSPQLRYLKGVEETIGDSGQVIEKQTKQSLGERLQIVPALLARGIGRTYELRRTSARFQKLRRTIARRDAIVHPRWDRYVGELGWWEAAEGIDSVELYLDSVASPLHPYLAGYFPFLYTIPGHDDDEVAVGHRTLGKRGPKLRVSTMNDVGIREVLVNEWIDSIGLTHFALESDCEGDSEGSMLTRAALVLLYAMLDAQLSVVSQWRMHETPDAFKEPEVNFLNEFAVGVGHDGEVWVGEDHQSFKKRIKAIPAILSRRVEGKEVSLDFGKKWGKNLIDGHALRNKVMHSAYGEPLPRVTKSELIRSAEAVVAYFEELRAKLPTTFQYVGILMKSGSELLKKVASS